MTAQRSPEGLLLTNPCSALNTNQYTKNRKIGKNILLIFFKSKSFLLHMEHYVYLFSKNLMQKKPRISIIKYPKETKNIIINKELYILLWLNAFILVDYILCPVSKLNLILKGDRHCRRLKRSKINSPKKYALVRCSFRLTTYHFILLSVFGLL